MVRLKVDTELVQALAKHISIPYGSIKRCSKFSAHVVFQFLMVRLKVYKTQIEDLETIIFQFLMVRLKVNNGRCHIQKFHDFNSLWFD